MMAQDEELIYKNGAAANGTPVCQLEMSIFIPFTGKNKHLSIQTRTKRIWIHFFL